MFDKGQLQKMLVLAFVNEKGCVHRLFKASNGSHMVFARPHVIYQWLVILVKVHPHYSAFNILSFCQIQRDIEEANQAIHKDATVRENPELCEFDNNLGSHTTDQLGEHADAMDGISESESSEFAMSCRLVTKEYQTNPISLKDNDTNMEFFKVIDKLVSVFNNNDNEETNLLSNKEHLKAQLDTMQSIANTNIQRDAPTDQAHYIA